MRQENLLRTSAGIPTQRVNYYNQGCLNGYHK